jgi:hypothetical protein
MAEHASNVSRCQFVAISSDLFGHATSRIFFNQCHELFRGHADAGYSCH